MDYNISFEKPTRKLFQEIQTMDQVAFMIDPIPVDWYMNNYKKLEWIAVARDPQGEMIGYKIIAGLTQHIFEAIKMGLLSGDYSISHRSYLGLFETNKIYMASTAIKPNYQNIGVARRLTEASVDELKRKHKHLELISIAVSDGGAKLASSIGMKMIDMVNSRRIMYGEICS